jgi:hypothetical protein
MNRVCIRAAVAAVSVAAFAASAHAHYSQRVWVDVNAAGKITTLVGPPGDSPAPYSAGQFTAGSVYARDMGSTDVAYTTLLGGPLATDGDTDDDGDNFQSDFPGYEATPFPSTNFSGTFNISFTKAPLYYIAGPSGAAGHFVPVATAFAGQKDGNGNALAVPYFTISNTAANYGGSGNTVYTITSPATDAAANPAQTAPAFTVGGHAHPGITLEPNSFDDDYAGSSDPDDPVDSDQYDGIYAIGLQLSAPGYTPSDTFYLVLGKNEPLSEVAEAGIVAEDTLLDTASAPEPTSLAMLLGAGGGLLLPRRRRRRAVR